MNLKEINIGEKIIQALKMMNMPQTALATRLGIPVSTLNGYITGRYLPEYVRLKEIAINIGVSSDFLLGIETETSFSDDEFWIVLKYRKLDESKKKDIIRFFNFLMMEE